MNSSTVILKQFLQFNNSILHEPSIFIQVKFSARSLI